MKLTPAAATSTCTSPGPGSGTSCSRSSRTLRSPGSVTKTLVAVVMPATLRPAPPPHRGGGGGVPDADEQGHLLLQGRQQRLGVGHDRLVGHDADPQRVVVGDDAEPERVAPRAGHPAQYPGDRDAREVPDLPRTGDVGRDPDRLVREEVDDAALERGGETTDDGDEGEGERGLGRGLEP